MVGRFLPPEPSIPGSGLKELFIPFFDDDGHLEIKESGIFDRQEQIDSNAAACDISVLIARFEAGDITALNRRQGMFGDFTSAPDSYRQALEIIHSFNSAFDGLSPEQREGSKNSFEFLDKIKSAELDNQPVPDPASESEV
ncbi:VP3 [Gokushovirus WZ-2015a]|nr:VP3 [Gokushovirus WZ-2015a]